MKPFIVVSLMYTCIMQETWVSKIRCGDLNNMHQQHSILAHFAAAYLHSPLMFDVFTQARRFMAVRIRPLLIFLSLGAWRDRADLVIAHAAASLQSPYLKVGESSWSVRHQQGTWRFVYEL